MAPSSARRNPETRKPARALPLPGARVALVLPAMSIVFDCIISDGGLGKGGRGRANPGTDGAASGFPAKGAGNPWQSRQSPGGGLSKFVEGLPKTGGPGAAACAFSRLRMARGVHHSVYRFGLRG